MCEIKPKHKAFFRLEAFTSGEMTAEEFTAAVVNKILAAEMELNKDGRFRFHIHEERK